jgi:hypothetical protein
MHHNRFLNVVLAVSMLFLLFPCGSVLAGPYTEDAVTVSEINAWATGYLDYSPSDPLDPDKYGQYTPGGGVYSTFQTPDNALGEADSAIVTLGDLYQEQIDAGASCGSITLTFDTTITNGDGYDFAVFENGFESNAGGLFAELGYVLVSTDGDYWALFPSVSLTEDLAGAYGTIDPTDVYNLAGKHANNYGTSGGTGFDLSDLLDNALVLAGLVDLDEINYVQIVDIPGSGDYYDSEGNPIYDAWVTWGSGGFDLDAVGVINAVPIPAAVWLLGSGLLGLVEIRRKTKF